MLASNAGGGDLEREDKGLFENRIHMVMPCTVHQKRMNYEGTRQCSGVATVEIGDICHRVSDSGQDPKGLGWWSWIKLQGKLLGRGEETSKDGSEERDAHKDCHRV